MDFGRAVDAVAHHPGEIEYERGGYIVWQFNVLLDAYQNDLGGVIPDTWGQSACRCRYNLMSFKS